jgi:hypothetical protein
MHDGSNRTWSSSTHPDDSWGIHKGYHPELYLAARDAQLLYAAPGHCTASLPAIDYFLRATHLEHVGLVLRPRRSIKDTPLLYAPPSPLAYHMRL